jgi:hypothetical protein
MMQRKVVTGKNDASYDPEKGMQREDKEQQLSAKLNVMESHIQ